MRFCVPGWLRTQCGGCQVSRGRTLGLTARRHRSDSDPHGGAGWAERRHGRLRSRPALSLQQPQEPQLSPTSAAIGWTSLLRWTANEDSSNGEHDGWDHDPLPMRQAPRPVGQHVCHRPRRAHQRQPEANARHDYGSHRQARDRDVLPRRLRLSAAKSACATTLKVLPPAGASAFRTRSASNAERTRRCTCLLLPRIASQSREIRPARGTANDRNRLHT